jgi:glycosyltransferase involved in cell wall biosynthesis
LVLLEAWANGVPNAGYRAGGIADVIRDGEDGKLVRCGDIAALAVAMSEVIEDADLRHRMGRAGLDRVTRDFRWDDKLRMVRQVYQTLAGCR